MMNGKALRQEIEALALDLERLGEAAVTAFQLKMCANEQGDDNQDDRAGEDANETSAIAVDLDKKAFASLKNSA